MSAWICKRSLRDCLVSSILFGVLAVRFTMLVEPLCAFWPFEIMPFAGTKTECNQDGE
jgi:hypothetical protein